MNREKIQIAFIYLVILLLILGIGWVGYYFYAEHQKWQGYRNDPAKKAFIERIDNILQKPKGDRTIEDYTSLGNSYDSIGEYSLAVGAYKSSLGKGYSAVAAIDLANAYVENKEYKKAENQYYELIKKTPGAMDSYLKLADLYKKDWQGKKSDTLGILLQGLSANQGSYDVLVALGQFYRDVNNDPVKALEYLKKAYQVNKNDSLAKDIKDLESK